MGCHHKHNRQEQLKHCIPTVYLFQLYVRNEGISITNKLSKIDALYVFMFNVFDGML